MKGTVVNWEYPFLNWGSLDISRTVPFIKFYKSKITLSEDDSAANCIMYSASFSRILFIDTWAIWNKNKFFKRIVFLVRKGYFF